MFIEFKQNYETRHYDHNMVSMKLYMYIFIAL